MNKFDELLKGFDLEYFGTAKHKISAMDVLAMVKEDKAIFLDVRTKEEVAILKYSFAYNIPLSELPERKDELSKDKLIAIFCGASARAAMASMYLQVNGYDNVKLVTESNGELANLIKPGFALKRSRG
jgi:rhodanese-related sulfurtransferase